MRTAAATLLTWFMLLRMIEEGWKCWTLLGY